MGVGMEGGGGEARMPQAFRRSLYPPNPHAAPESEGPASRGPSACPPPPLRAPVSCGAHARSGTAPPDTPCRVRRSGRHTRRDISRRHAHAPAPPPAALPAWLKVWRLLQLKRSPSPRTARAPQPRPAPRPRGRALQTLGPRARCSIWQSREVCEHSVLVLALTAASR